jgi:hypothetical protein
MSRLLIAPSRSASPSLVLVEGLWLLGLRNDAMSTKMITALPFFFLIALLLTGCSTTPARPSAGPESARNEGYSLLYDLARKEKDVNKLLLLKKEQADVNDAIQEIARVMGDAERQLKEFAHEDPTLQLKTPGLPWAEQKTRAAIESARAKKLLLTSGQQFELRLLLSQAEGLSYGSHLARVLQQQEKDIRRKMFLEELSRQLERSNDTVINLLSSRMRPR